MKRYILDEVATRDEATHTPTLKRCGLATDSENFFFTTMLSRGESWVRMTVLEGSPEQIAEQMMKLAVEVGA